ncbi:hypothetical protein [Streptomyces sp. SHP 1-2]|uniref:DUF7848 domain-containing protein n=1 Tax=Streptomyces sp. SHP 1-2 TaxID=2769489 RepID=UPI002240E6A3|nr:hypothetical protein [Streptomyces sp. SHP 1-2]MCW5252998.1 hypothetical protein [Streptomyces sp. SHP 1-2]
MEPGTLVYDRHTRAVGEYRGPAGPRVTLRQVGGGREWQADPAALRAVTPEERRGAGGRAAEGLSPYGVWDARPLVPAGPAPEPVAGCVDCAALTARRETARAAGDGSAETDADVLLGRHLRDGHPGAPLPRRVPYSILPDPSARPEYEARCVSGEGAGCGAASGPCQDPADVEDWQRRHARETRHLRYRRSATDHALLVRLAC